MDLDAIHGLSRGLGEAELRAAEWLLEACNRHERLDLPIALRTEGGYTAATQHFLYHDRGALVGLAWLPDDPEPEACGMVHPDHRRRGIGRALLRAVREEAGKRGLDSFLVVCDEAPASGPRFLAAEGARYRSSEYRLELDVSAVDPSGPRHAGLRLVGAGDQHEDVLVRLRSDAFGSAEEEARRQVARGLRAAHRRYYIGLLDGEPVGMLGVSELSGSVDITAFGVLPEHRGRGHGRRMLLDTIDMLLGEGRERIVIEVATENRNVLGLYKSCGFRIVAGYGYYETGRLQLSGSSGK